MRAIALSPLGNVWVVGGGGGEWWWTMVVNGVHSPPIRHPFAIHSPPYLQVERVTVEVAARGGAIAAVPLLCTVAEEEEESVAAMVVPLTRR